MADNISREKRSHTMRAVKSKDSKMEVEFRSALWRLGLRFYKNAKNLIGKPDLVFPKKRIAIFLDSCFWHGCPLHLRMPKSKLDYWQPKIERNKNRDADVNAYYLENNWQIIRIWEHDLKTDFDNKVSEVARIVHKSKNNEE